jgi:hypothetical protein
MIVNMVAPWGTKYHYMSGIHTNVTTVQLPSGQAWYSYLWDKPQNGGNDPVGCVSPENLIRHARIKLDESREVLLHVLAIHEGLSRIEK